MMQSWQIGVNRQIRAKPNELNLLTGYRCIFSLLNISETVFIEEKW